MELATLDHREIGGELCQLVAHAPVDRSDLRLIPPAFEIYNGGDRSSDALHSIGQKPRERYLGTAMISQLGRISIMSAVLLAFAALVLGG